MLTTDSLHWARSKREKHRVSKIRKESQSPLQRLSKGQTQQIQTSHHRINLECHHQKSLIRNLTNWVRKNIPQRLASHLISRSEPERSRIKSDTALRSGLGWVTRDHDRMVIWARLRALKKPKRLRYTTIEDPPQRRKRSAPGLDQAALFKEKDGFLHSRTCPTMATKSACDIIIEVDVNSTS